MVDMQNDFVIPTATLAIGRGNTLSGKFFDMPFLMGTIPHVKRLAVAFREAGRPEGVT